MSGSIKSNLIKTGAVVAVVVPLQIYAVGFLGSADKSLASLWVSRMSYEEIDRAAQNIGAYPSSYRRALAHSLPPARQAQLWRQNAEEYLKAHPELTAEQTRLVTEIIQTFSEEAFAFNPEAVQPRLQRLGDETTRLLGKDAFGYLLIRLGPEDRRNAASVTALPWRVRLEDVARRYLLLQANGSGDCECKQGSTECGPEYWCMLPFTGACDWVNTGCGLTGKSVCDGLCIPIPAR